MPWAQFQKPGHHGDGKLLRTGEVKQKKTRAAEDEHGRHEEACAAGFALLNLPKGKSLRP